MIPSGLTEILRGFPEAELELLVETRRDLHRHPELAFAERRTSQRIRGRLEALGVPFRPVGGTGLAADLGKGSGLLMLRADMDALPLTEDNDVPYASTDSGAMHACGHDGHVAIGLAVLERLAARPAAVPIRSLFQPAEEGAGGAEAVVRDGGADGIAGVLGIHLWNELPAGKVGLVAGPQMAAVDEFEIVVTGAGGHGAKPHQTADTVLAAARIVEGLQSIVAREISALDAAVVTVSSIHGGTAFNIIPKEVRLRGTARSFSEEVHRALPGKIARIVDGLARACGVEAKADYRRINKATVNHAPTAALVAAACERLLGPACVVETRTMGGEDMSVFLERVPGCFFFVGSAPEGRPRPHHSPIFDFDERALAVGTVLLEAAARSLADTLSAR
jgi:amidohydrolase